MSGDDGDLVPCDLCERLVPRAELALRSQGEVDYGICPACRGEDAEV